MEVPGLLFSGLAERSARSRLTGRRLWHDREPGANKFFQPDETRPAGLPFSDSQHRASLLDEPKELRLSFRRWNFQEKQLLSFDDQELAALRTAAAALQPGQRDRLLKSVASALGCCVAIGPGTVAQIATAVQRSLLAHV